MSRRTLKINTVKDLIRSDTVVTFAEVKNAIGPVCHLTVNRVISQAGCRTSYSHNGRYYTLDELADYDHHGLWSYNDIRFSRNGPLTKTLITLIEQSSSGLFAEDLKSIVNVDVVATLTRLSKEGRVARKRIGRKYLYESTDSDTRKQQRRKKKESASTEWGKTMTTVTNTLVETLNERDRRLFAGWFSLYLGRGGDPQSAQLLEMSRSTVTRGRKQLLSGEFEKDRVRRSGGGRESCEKKPQHSDPHTRCGGSWNRGRSNIGEIMVSEYDRKCCLNLEHAWNSDHRSYGLSNS